MTSFFLVPNFPFFTSTNFRVQAAEISYFILQFGIISRGVREVPKMAIHPSSTGGPHSWHAHVITRDRCSYSKPQVCLFYTFIKIDAWSKNRYLIIKHLYLPRLAKKRKWLDIERLMYNIGSVDIIYLLFYTLVRKNTGGISWGSWVEKTVSTL